MLFVGIIQLLNVHQADAAMLQIEYNSTLTSGSTLNGSPVGVHGHPLGTSFTMRATFNTAVDLDPSLGTVPFGMGVFAAQSVQFDLNSYGTFTAAPGSLNVFFRNIGGFGVDTGILPSGGGIEPFRVFLGVSPGVFNPDNPVPGVFGSGTGSFVSPTTIPLVGGGTLGINGLTSSFSSVTITALPDVPSVPEPASFALVMISGVALVGWRKRTIAGL